MYPNICDLYDIISKDLKKIYTMEIMLRRTAKKDTYTIGKLYIDGVYFCDTLEDKDRDLKQSMASSEIAKIKVKGSTAIPMGTYKVTTSVVSPRLSKENFYIVNCKGGRVPRLLNVPGFDGVLIHSGNTPAHTDGCILLGQNKVTGQVINSKDTCIKFYQKVFSCKEPITITIR